MCCGHLGYDLEQARGQLVHKLGAGSTPSTSTPRRGWHRGGEHARRQRPSVAEGTVLLMLAALRGCPSSTGPPAGKGWPSTRASVRRSATSAAAPWGWSATATSPSGGDHRGRDGRRCLHTSTRDDGHPGWRPCRTSRRQRHRLVAPAADREDRRHARPRRAGPDEARRGARQHLTRRRRRRGRARRRAAQRRGWPPRASTCSRVEPIPADNPLLGLDNVVLTPHVTWYTVDTMRRYLEHAVDNCRRIRDGRELGQRGQRVGSLPTDRLIGKAPQRCSHAHRDHS